MRGFYEFRNISSGIYEVRLQDNVGYMGRPIGIWGIVVKPGVRERLDIQTDEGAGIKAIEQPGASLNLSSSSHKNGNACRSRLTPSKSRAVGSSLHRRAVPAYNEVVA